MYNKRKLANLYRRSNWFNTSDPDPKIRFHQRFRQRNTLKFQIRKHFRFR
jgi:hypothetical protein